MRFGRYELLRPLGRGGMAEVFLARYVGPEGFEKRLVIKRLLTQLADDRALLRMFFEEAKTHVSLSHGNLVSVFDFGRVGDAYFIAMEYVDGVDLATLSSADRALPPAWVAYLGIELCRGLGYVHRRGLVHRDVSPRNVLVTIDGEVKLSDFGLVLAQHRDPAGVRGTLAYTSPEQARGEPVDGCGDLCSLGLVLAEALTGRRVRDAEDRAAALAQAREGEPAVVEGPLAEVLRRATARATADRWKDAEEMAAALERVAAGLGEGRETIARALGARVAELASRDSAPSAAPAAAPGTTAPEPRPAALVETYFRDHDAATFVEDVLAETVVRTPPPTRAGGRVIAAVAGAMVLGAVVFYARPRATAPHAAAMVDLAAAADLAPVAAAAPDLAVRDDLAARPHVRTPHAPEATSTLVIRCTPWCVPSVDGKVRGEDGRSHTLTVPAGTRKVSVRRLDDHKERSVTLRPGESRIVDFQFDAKFD